MKATVPGCSHTHLLRERLFHRGRWNDDPVRRVVDLCAGCRADFRAADIGLETADGKRWREPTRESPLPLRAPQQLGADAVLSTERAAPTPTSAVVAEVGASPVVQEAAVEATKKTCSEKGCKERTRAKGLCSKHYDQQRPRPRGAKNGQARNKAAEAKRAEANKYSPPLQEQEAAPAPEGSTGEQEAQALVPELPASVHEQLATQLETLRLQRARIVELEAELKAQALGADAAHLQARLRAWELWHQEQDLGGSPYLQDLLLRIARGGLA